MGERSLRRVVFGNCFGELEFGEVWLGRFLVFGGLSFIGDFWKARCGGRD